ncbi:MAG: alpha-mannosyltransferase [Dehalococcoidia bacterium]|nr:alpha-mannosyltransferase [Dehalococcoidia bacterium]|tara:strand:+ start:1514 stop:2584 length:1071 start_codon:yes stop_codon:yes gene_type:complete
MMADGKFLNGADHRISSNNLVLISEAWSPQINGVVTTLKNIIPFIESNGIKVTLIEPSQFRSISLIGYPDVQVTFPFSSLPKKLSQIDPDYIHIATEGPLGLIARNWAIKNHKSFTTSYHTNLAEYAWELYKIPTYPILNYMKWFHSKSSHVLVPTNSIYNYLESKKFSNLKVWTRGIDPNIFSDHIKTENILPKNKKAKVLLYVGRVSKEKNLSELCNIAKDSDYECWIVGDGPYLNTLKNEFSEHVQFFGAIDHEKLTKYYKSADIFVFPSLTDTFGLVLIESMSCGTPVAAYPVKGPIDIVKQGVSGSLNKDLLSAIKEAQDIPRSNVANYGKKFTWENCAKIFLETLSLNHK